MNTFRVTLLSIFGVLAITGFALFITIGPGSGGDVQRFTPITVWGSIPSDRFNGAVNQINKGRPESRRLSVSYRQIEGDFSEALIRGFAQGETPDALLIRHDKLMDLEDFIQGVPIEQYTERRFKNNFVESAEIYLRDGGILGVPFAVDPLLMYWNRDMFTNAGFAQPPSRWQQIPNVVNKLTERDFSGNLTRSAISFGEFENVNNAKAILSTLFQQTGNEIVSREGDRFESELLEGNQGDGEVGGSPASALEFYTAFSNPSTQLYSWNRSLPESRTRFTAGNLSLYFGFASEASELRQLNPNLNFGVAPIPQAKQEDKSVYGQLYAFSIVSRAQNHQGILRTLEALTSESSARAMADAVGGVSLRRSHVAEGSANALESVAYESALITEVWPDPNPQETDSIFSRMISDITSGRQSVGGALNRANTRLKDLLRE